MLITPSYSCHSPNLTLRWRHISWLAWMTSQSRCQGITWSSTWTRLRTVAFSKHCTPIDYSFTTSGWFTPFSPGGTAWTTATPSLLERLHLPDLCSQSIFLLLMPGINPSQVFQHHTSAPFNTLAPCCCSHPVQKSGASLQVQTLHLSRNTVLFCPWTLWSFISVKAIIYSISTVVKWTEINFWLSWHTGRLSKHLTVHTRLVASCMDITDVLFLFFFVTTNSEQYSPSKMNQCCLYIIF